MSTVIDYVGRTTDLLAFHGQQMNQSVEANQVLVEDGSSGKIIAGIAKLAQRWLIEFLTVRGSVRALPLRGCRFISDMRNGSMRTTLDAEQSFHLSAREVARNLVLEEETGIPADEAYGSVTLNSITISADALLLSVTLTSKAGESHDLLFPLTTKLQ